MFSVKSFINKVRFLVISLVLTGFIALLSTASSGVQAANQQLNGNIPHHQESASIPSIALEAWKVANASSPQPADPSVSSVSSLNQRPEDWQSWPVLPSVSASAYHIYQRGLEMGNNPHAFSKIGDGEISAAWFLTDFDLGADYYDLGANTDLQTVINYFSGSFARQSQAARRGFNAQRVLDPARADPTICDAGESPLDCEIRLQHPSFALISMGTNQVWQPELFESGMREIIETLLAHNVVPVLSAKADNLEGDHAINFIIARLAVEYDIPVWNFWRAVQPLPNHGLQRDLEHLTYFPNDFSAPAAMQFAWPLRNLSGLQALKSLMEATQP